MTDLVFHAEKITIILAIVILLRRGYPARWLTPALLVIFAGFEIYLALDIVLYHALPPVPR